VLILEGHGRRLVGDGGLWRCQEFAGIATLLRAAHRGLAFDHPPASVVAQLPALGDLRPAWRTLALLGCSRR
jgi:hypothetical protein